MRARDILIVLPVLAAASAAAGSGTPARLGEAEVTLVYGLGALHEAVALAAAGQDAAAGEKLDAADAELRAAVELLPDDGNARLLLGLAELLRGDAESAEASFAAGRGAAKPPDPSLRAAVERAAGRIAADGPAAAIAELEGVVAAYAAVAFRRLAVDRPPLWAAQSEVTIANDSNPSLLAEDFFLETPEGSLVDGSASDVVATLSPRFELRPVFDRAGWSLGLTVDGSYSLHGDLNYLDLTAGQMTVTAGRGRSPLGFLAGPLGAVRVPVGNDRVAFVFQGGGDYYRVDGSSYLRRLATAASATFYVPRLTAATQVDLLAQERAFFAGDLGDPRRSGRSIALQVSQTFFFRAGDRYLRVGVLAEESSAERPFEASSLQPSLETHLPFGKRWSFHLAGTLRLDDYDHPESDLFNANPLTPSRLREDDTWRLTAILSRRLTDEVHLGLRLTRTQRDSNLSGPGGLSLDYERWVMAMRMSCFLGGGG
jgi:hypothetical protein